jgi:hypothetical protein
MFIEATDRGNGNGGVKVKIPISARLFIAGIVCFAFFFLFPGHPKYFRLLGLTAWDCAYFVVLVHGYKRKEPVPTRNSLVKYENQPGLFKTIYFLMFFVGIFALLAIFLTNLGSG